jgi:uncharacterized protein YbjT (DUF2867 family)
MSITESFQKEVLAHPIPNNTETLVLVAGATGDLGGRIIQHLDKNGARVRALIRKGTTKSGLESLGRNVELIEVDYNNREELVAACKGVDVVVSALSGLRDVIVDAQSNLLEAAVTAKVPRFLPSDFSIDFTKLPEGSNRNLDLRREFYHRINAAPIKATSILNGMFMDLLKEEAPVILKKLNRVIYWGSKTQDMDFTSIDNTAEYTAHAVLDGETPRFLKIAGEVANIKDLAKDAERAFGNPFKTTRVGGLGTLQVMWKIFKSLDFKKKQVFPPWQGMQYLHNMLTGLPKFEVLDNERYPVRWTTVEEILSVVPTGIEPVSKV